MRFTLAIPLLFFCTAFVFSQKSIDAALDKYNEQSIPYISVTELNALDSVVLFDTRKQEEYNVSHLKNAHWTGYGRFTIANAKQLVPDTTATIVVYCSIGVRSEDIGEKLKKAGYTNVSNLYGGIFQWKAEGNPVYDNSGKPTEKVHAFSKQWGKLLTNAQKIYTAKPE